MAATKKSGGWTPKVESYSPAGGSAMVFADVQTLDAEMADQSFRWSWLEDDFRLQNVPIAALSFLFPNRLRPSLSSQRGNTTFPAIAATRFRR
jgi:hypothetical protein